MGLPGEGNKMKTKLAAQTLSKSVATSLTNLKGKNHGVNFDFTKDDLDPTIKLLTVFNDLFDILNSRQFSGINYKNPLSRQTKDLYFKRFDEATEYIMGLQIEEYQPKKDVFIKVNLVNGPCRTGFIGFLVGIIGAKSLYDQYVEKGELKFLLTHKLSQDHLETLFSVIRSKGGHNDNPNCVHFKAAIKAILMHNELKATINANCENDDTIPFNKVNQKKTSNRGRGLLRRRRRRGVPGASIGILQRCCNLHVRLCGTQT